MGIVKRYADDLEATTDLQSSHLAVREHALQYFGNLEDEHKIMAHGQACRHGVIRGGWCGRCHGTEPDQPHCSRCAQKVRREGD